MLGERELVGLLYRADWTRLRLSAGLTKVTNGAGGNGVVAVLDADLGILLSLASYAAGRPLRRQELRGVTLTGEDPPDPTGSGAGAVLSEAAEAAGAGAAARVACGMAGWPAASPSGPGTTTGGASRAGQAPS